MGGGNSDLQKFRGMVTQTQMLNMKIQSNIPMRCQFKSMCKKQQNRNTKSPSYHRWQLQKIPNSMDY